MHCCNFLSLFDSKFPNSVQYFCTEMSPYALLKFQQWVLTSYWVAETILLKILLTQCGNSFEMSVEAGTLVINVQYGAGLCMYFWMVVVILLWTLVDGCHIFGYHTMPSCHHVLLNVTLLTVSDTLRALYLGDNDFETIPPDICKLANLQIVSGYPSSDLVSYFHTILYLYLWFTICNWLDYGFLSSLWLEP